MTEIEQLGVEAYADLREGRGDAKLKQYFAAFIADRGDKPEDWQVRQACHNPDVPFLLDAEHLEESNRIPCAECGHLFDAGECKVPGVCMRCTYSNQMANLPPHLKKRVKQNLIAVGLHGAKLRVERGKTHSKRKRKPNK